MIKRLVFFFSCSVLLAASTAVAQVEDYPNRPITFVVPFVAGSFADASARFLADDISKKLRQPVVIENIGGANGIVAVNNFLQRPADGYTIFIASNTTHGANPSLYKTLRYDPSRDFTPVACVLRTPMVLVVRPGVPATTVEELVSYAKQNPGTLTYGESSAVQRAGAELFKVRTKTDIRRIPYKGSPQIITDLMGGRIDMFVSDPVTASPHIQSGALRALAVTTKSRSSALPDVTTMEEVGVADYDISGWVAAFLPTGAPPEITRKLNAAFVATLSTPEFAAFAAKTGAEPSPCSSEQLAQQVANEVEKWRTLTEIAGIEKQ